ncbi:hypothetical protein [Streptomyces sp. NPDC094032]|uniref:hypothetical protein n=1 Tax=Streptomyces sp. NPDC094032 TaxID=3155308 RepID=UPI0033234FFB
MTILEGTGQAPHHARLFGSFGAPVLPDELAAAAGRQRHGGRGGTGLLHGERWALGSNRLAAGTPSADCRPCRLPSVPGVVAVLDGEIYNHRELRRRMRGRGHVVPDTGAGALLPALYATYGTEFAAELDGMFAVAVVDLRGPGRLVLATDGQGAKTLYHHSAPDGAVHFASELPGLLAFSHVPARPRELSLDDVLTLGPPRGDRTHLDGITALPAGAVAVATGTSGLRVRVGRRGGGGAADPGEETRRVLPADGRVCVIGPDDGTPGDLAVSAARHLAELGHTRLHTFHLVRRGARRPSSGPRPLTDRRVRVVRHPIVADPRELADLLPRTIWHLGQPDPDPAAVETSLLLRGAVRAGFSVALAERTRPGHVRPMGVPARLRESLYTPEYGAYVRAHAEGRERSAPLRDGQLRRLDHLGAAWGVEVRVPRRGARDARPPLAPPAPVPLLTRGSPLTALARDVLAPSDLTRDGRLDPRSVEAFLTAQHRTPTPEGSRAVLSLLSHELWLRELRALRPVTSRSGVRDAVFAA